MHATWIWLYQNKSPNSLISDDGIPFLKSLEVMIEIFDYLVKNMNGLHQQSLGPVNELIEGFIYIWRANYNIQLVFEISRCLISRIFSFAFVKLKVRF